MLYTELEKRESDLTEQYQTSRKEFQDFVIQIKGIHGGKAEVMKAKEELAGKVAC